MTVDGGKIAQLVDSGIERQGGWLDPLAERIQGALTQVIEQSGPTGRRVKNFLNGTWLGHPLHPVLTDAAIGAWFTGAMLDLMGEESGADAALGLGIVCALPTAASGLADWHDQNDRPRRMGLVHAMFNGGALALFVGSWLARRSGHRSLGIGLSTSALSLATAGAYLGGELVFTHGTQVNRNAWDPEAKDWQAVARVDDLGENQLVPAEIEAGEQKIPLVLLKKGREIYAINGSCTHLGAPLAEGELLDDYCLQCPWHKSQFDLRDGSVKQGPAAYPQVSFETRQRAGSVEVRAKT